MRPIQLLILCAFWSGCLAHDKHRFEKTIQRRRGRHDIHSARRLGLLSSEETEEVEYARGHAGDEPPERNVFMRPTSQTGFPSAAPALPLTASPSSSPSLMTTGSPTTIQTAAPSIQTAAPSIQTAAPSIQTAAPSIQTAAPSIQTAAPLGVTSSPVTSLAPVSEESSAPTILVTSSIGGTLVLYTDPFTTLLTMINALDPEAATTLLAGEPLIPFTLFAPTDTALQSLGSADADYFNELYQNPIWANHLECFVYYHVLFNTTLLSSAFVNNQSVPTLNGVDVVLGTNPYSVNLIPIADPDLVATNGVVHVLQEAPLQLPCTSESIWQQGIKSRDLTTLFGLAQAAELELILDNNMPLTIFAPTEAAFESVSTDALLYLIDPANLPALEEVMRYHLLQELVFLGNDTETRTVNTVNGQPIIIDFEPAEDGSRTFNVQGGTSDNIATVIPDGINILAKNGVIHLIDQLLLPPGFSIGDATPTTAAPVSGTTVPVSGGTTAPATNAPAGTGVGSSAPNSVPSTDTLAPVTLQPAIVGPPLSNAPILPTTGSAAPITAPPVGDSTAPVDGSVPTAASGAPATAAPAAVSSVGPVTGSPAGVSTAPAAVPTTGSGAPITVAPAGPSTTTSPVAPTDASSRAAILDFLGSTLTDASVLNATDSVQRAAFEALLVTNPTLDPVDETDQLLIKQVYALHTLFFATNFTGWLNQGGWVTGAPFCSSEGNWFGVTCADNDLSRVTGLVLNENGLSGFIPSEIRGLESLIQLELANSENGNTFLTGEIPTTIGEMVQLQIVNLSTNSFGFIFPPDKDQQPIPATNALPTELANLVQLTSFNVADNFVFQTLSFDAFIPMTNLVELDLSINIFTGTIPTSIGSLSPSLTTLNLDNNRYVGTIPTEVGILVNLVSLKMSTTDSTPEPLGLCPPAEEAPGEDSCLGGAIPSEIGNLVNLEELWLFANSLDGPIPTEIGNCVALKNLVAYANQLTGTVPTEFGNLVSLTTLDLSTNFLGESLTSELFSLAPLVNLNLGFNVFNNTKLPQTYNLPNIQVLRLDRNAFSGIVPTSLAVLQSLQILDLGSNFLTGTIPSVLGSFTQMQNLVLEINSLTGPIPTELGNLGGTLQQLQIAANKFTGAIPTELALLTGMLDLELTNNALTGNIPTELGNLVSLLELEMDINDLVGPIPTELGLIVGLTRLRVEKTLLTGAMPDQVCSLTSSPLVEIVSDCGGDAPEVVCSCCTTCEPQSESQTQAPV